MKNKKIAFILYDYPLGTSMMIVNTISLLKRYNEVVVFLNDDQHKNIFCESWLSDLVISLPSHILPRNKLMRVLLKVAKGTWNLFLSFLGPLVSWDKKNSRLFAFANHLKKELLKTAYDVLMPVESLSLIAANYACDGRAHIVYFDMELLDWSAENPLYRNKIELKKRQVAALRNVDHVMITSPKRANIFANINHFDPQRISVLPVVPLKQHQGKRSGYFREKFSISDKQFIVVYTGNFKPWAQCIEVIKSMDGWPDNAVLVMHTWNQQILTSLYFNKMKRAARGRPVFFSTEYLLLSDLNMALTSADVGLLFYGSIDANFTEICFSSNKMGEYVAAGLPIIASPFPSLKCFIEQQGIGKAVPFEEIGNAIREISDNIDIYHQNVKKCATKLFSFEKYFSTAWENYDSRRRH
jgi:glycosyltransferase involved in cell wall biosynthesis